MIGVLGLGEQGKAISSYIYDTTNELIISVDLNNYETKWSHFKTDGTITKAFEIFDSQNKKLTIINCLPTEYIFEATRSAVERGWNIVDLGGVIEVEKEQDKLLEQAMKNGSIVVKACGLAPGIVQSFAQIFATTLDNVKNIYAFCGGVPKYPTYPLGYIRVFYPGGIIKEYTGVVEVFENGVKYLEPTLSKREHLFIPSFGIMEADLTSGVKLDIWDKNIGFCYKTLRYPGHFDYVKNNILNQPNPDLLLSKIIDPVSFEEPDVVILHFSVEMDNDFYEVTYFWEYDYDRNISAMAQATGYIVAEVALNLDYLIPGIHNMQSFNPYGIINKIRRYNDKNFSTDTIIF